MLNQERVQEMTKMAMFDQKEGRIYAPVIQYFRKDYVAKEMLKSLLSGTIAFGIVVALYGLCHVEELLEQLNAIDVRQVVMQMLLCYGIGMAVYLCVTYVVYFMRYKTGRKKVKKYYMHLKRVNKIYQEDEQNEYHTPRKWEE